VCVSLLTSGQREKLLRSTFRWHRY
jgi:hypothetical protein